MDTQIDDLVAKVKAIAQGPDGDILKGFVDLLFDRQEEDDLSPEELRAFEESEAAYHQGDRSRLIPLENFEKKLCL